MNKLFNSRPVIAFLTVMTAFSFTACVNEEYDISNGIDMDMTLLPNTTIPLGNVPPISISSLLGDTQSASSILKEDRNGNLSLSFGSDRITQSFTMPEVEIGGDGGIKFDDNVEVQFIPKYKGLSLGGYKVTDLPPGVPNEIHFSQSQDDGKELERSFSIDLHKELPEQIVSIDEVHLDARILYKFKVSSGTVLHIAKGFTMKFPDFMVIEKPEVVDNYDIQNGEVVFIKDTRISEYAPFVLEISFIRMDIPEDAIVSVGKEPDVVRYIDFKDASVDVKGDLYLALDDYEGRTIPEMTTLLMDIELQNLRMKSAHVKLDLDIAIEDKEITIGELPEMFTGEGTVVDLYNPILRFNLSNGSPFNMYFNANITSYSQNHKTDIHIGDCTPYYDGDEHDDHATDPVVIYAEDEVEYYFSRRGQHDGTAGTDIMLENIGDMIKEMPESIAIHDILVETDDRFVNIEANKECKVEMEYEFISPLAFGQDLNIAFDYDINLGLDGDMTGLGSIVIDMNMVNTIPLDFTITGVALDDQGKEVKDASVNMNLLLAAGTLDQPVESPTKVVLSTSDMSSVAALRLKLKANSSKQMEGKVLNTAQGLGINDLHITLPDGITLNLNDINNNN